MTTYAVRASEGIANIGMNTGMRGSSGLGALRA